MNLERVLPLACFALFAFVGVGVRATLQVVRHGSTGVRFFRSGRADQSFREAMFLVIGAILLAHGILPLAAPSLLASISLPIASAPLMWVGAALVVVGTFLTFAAQVGMGASWRMGIEEGARPGLVTGGFYALSRNPIYALMIVSLVGFVLLVPTWVTLAMLVLAIVLVKQQARAEEEYLLRTYGDEFRAYARRVGRFVPGLGRLA
jgi:protein-S-isoprenylcysteine O-methyltransferase Ste14